MNKAEYKAAARRIMEKLGPMTPEEQQTYELLTKTPEKYMPPDPQTGGRVCGVCGKKFETRKVEGREVSALEQFTEHQAEHNPSPAQWGEAHKKIQKGKQNPNENEG